MIILGQVNEEILGFCGVLRWQGGDYILVFGFRGRNALSGELRLHLYEPDSGIGWLKWR